MYRTPATDEHAPAPTETRSFLERLAAAQERGAQINLQLSLDDMAHQWFAALLAEAEANPSRYAIEGASVTSWAAFPHQHDLAAHHQAEIADRINELYPGVRARSAGTVIHIR